MAENSRRDGPGGLPGGLLPPEDRVTARPKALGTQRQKDEQSQSVTRPRLDAAADTTSVPPRAESLLPALAKVGRYELLGRLAVGGMAEIFLARESVGQVARRVALKFIRPDIGFEAEFEQMFLNEARVAMGLTHPNICHVYEFNTAKRRYYLAMEYVDGVPLNKLLERARERNRAMSIAVIGSIFARVAEALHYAHTTKDERDRPLHIVHRDVTPHNIMVSYGGAVKLLDFGVAKVKLKADATRSESLKGKFGYMSPEQVAGRAVDGRSDVFSLGICLYEALVGERLYKRDSEFEAMRAIMEEPAPSVRAKRPDVPMALDEIVRKALAKAPDDRFASAGDMQDALEAHLAATRSLASSRVVARLMQSLFEEEIAEGPRIDRREDVTGAFVIPSLRPPKIPKTLDLPNIRDADARSEPPKSPLPRGARDKRTWIVAGAAVALIALVALVAALSSGPSAEPEATTRAGEAPSANEPATPTAAAPDRPAPELSIEEPPAEIAPDPLEAVAPPAAQPPEERPPEPVLEADPTPSTSATEGARRRPRRTARTTARTTPPPSSMRVAPEVVRTPGF